MFTKELVHVCVGSFHSVTGSLKSALYGKIHLYFSENKNRSEPLKIMFSIPVKYDFSTQPNGRNNNTWIAYTNLSYNLCSVQLYNNMVTVR